MTPEERSARILELETKLRNSMSEEERKAKAAFYYGIPTDQDFNIVILPPGSDCMAREGEAMTNNSGIVCNSKAAATAALETIAGTFPRGTQRDTLIAIMNWIKETIGPDFSPESEERIKRIFEELTDEGNQKALEWAAHAGEPPHGARVEVPFLFNADTKTWELEYEMPPTWTPEHFLPQSNEGLAHDADEE
jgi:hypothetical protein